MKLLSSVGGSGRTRVLLSLMRLHHLYGRATVRAVAADVGVSTTTAYWHLKRLRDEGLVAWEAGDNGGTLRPLVKRVA